MKKYENQDVPIGLPRRVLLQAPEPPDPSGSASQTSTGSLSPAYLLHAYAPINIVYARDGHMNAHDNAITYLTQILETRQT